MTALKIIIAVVCVIAFVCVCRALHRKRIVKKGFSLPDGFTVTAHTGAMGTKSNSYESLLKGYFNAEVVEFDVKFRNDNTPVLAHTNIDKDALTLEKAFAFIAERKSLRANIDMKDKNENLVRVQLLAEAYGITDRVFYTGIEEKDVAAVKENSPAISYYLNAKIDKKDRKNKEYLLSLAEKVKECGAVGINLDKNHVSPLLVEIFHENGLLVSVWTAKTKGEILKLLSLSPDNITTKKPDVLTAAIGR